MDKNTLESFFVRNTPYLTRDIHWHDYILEAIICKAVDVRVLLVKTGGGKTGLTVLWYGYTSQRAEQLEESRKTSIVLIIVYSTVPGSGWMVGKNDIHLACHVRNHRDCQESSDVDQSYLNIHGDVPA